MQIRVRFYKVNRHCEGALVLCPKQSPQSWRLLRREEHPPRNDEIYDAMLSYPVHHVLVRHEQGGAHMADGYARASGRGGVAMATSGPGATNLVRGIATAMMDSVPVVFITGQVAAHLSGEDAFQETYVTGITLPITK
ncbi:MAG: hypothetical protein HYU84_03540, partial [Chloroflexi bacterium]|nr:hypothetical protein [Chloroflexota bacterium]